jgi:hypothetical protein
LAPRAPAPNAEVWQLEEDTMTDSDITTLFGHRGPGQRTDAERAAYAKGYDDYRTHAAQESPSVVRPTFDPVAGHETSYQAGWDQAQIDAEAERREAAARLV